MDFSYFLLGPPPALQIVHRGGGLRPAKIGFAEQNSSVDLGYGVVNIQLFFNSATPPSTPQSGSTFVGLPIL
ncbi:hypothetical protein SODG_006322 [Sodalis praecaptivus]